MIFDRLGHCFSSTAGQALFDNADCTTQNATPVGEDVETVSFIREGEAHFGCSVDTSAMPSAAMRETYARFAPFLDLPAPDYVGGYGCIGYRGAPFPVLAGANETAAVRGMAPAGASVFSTYWGRPAGWIFVEVVQRDGEALIVDGWIRGVDLSPENCDMVAG